MFEIDIISVQPRMFEGFLSESIVARAVKKGICRVNVIDLKAYGIGRWKKTDDRPYGGGPGMLMRCEPWFAAVEPLLPARVVMTSPAGRRFTQKDAAELSREERVVFMCGHYEGFDARIETLATDVFSVGDFVLTGGEIPAAAMVDAVVRLIPGALGAGPAATADESFGSSGMLEPPQYTHPPSFRGMDVPEVLLSGDHRRIEAWKRRAAAERTRRIRPDLAKGGTPC